MKTYIPENIEIFEVSAAEFLNAETESWQAERLAERMAERSDADTERHPTTREANLIREANALAGFYWWACSPGCLPDSEASGPFETELEAIEDAGGGEYEDYIVAMAEEIGENPADVTEESYECYGLKVLSCGRAEYAVGTDEEADAAWDQSLDSYLDDCGLLDSIPENLRSYFDREAWKRDARFDGRGHALSSYDGSEMDLSDGYVAFRIN